MLAGRLISAARNTPGCLGATLAAGVEHPDRIVIVTEWNGAAAAAAHRESEPLLAFLANSVPGLAAARPKVTARPVTSRRSVL